MSSYPVIDVKAALMVALSVLVGAYMFHLSCNIIRSKVVRDKWYMQPINMALIAFVVTVLTQTLAVRQPVVRPWYRRLF